MQTLQSTFQSPLHFRHEEKYADNPRRDLVHLIGVEARDILEIGCSTGATGAIVKNAAPHVIYTGIEIDPQACAIARSRLDRVLVADIEKISLEDFGVAKSSFDIILFADVLEHLYDPWRVLATVREYLRPSGAIVASIPNIQNIQIIEQLARGYWTYAQHGLLDGTHVRFFTLAEIIRLFTWTGYRMEQCIANFLPEIPPENNWPRDLHCGDVVLKNVDWERAQQLYAFQYFVRARRNPDPVAGASI